MHVKIKGDEFIAETITITTAYGQFEIVGIKVATSHTVAFSIIKRKAFETGDEKLRITPLTTIKIKVE